MKSTLWRFVVSFIIFFLGINSMAMEKASATTPPQQSNTPVTPATPAPTTIIAQPPPPPKTLDEASFLNREIHDLATQIMRNFRNNNGTNGPVAVTTFVDINNLYRTSPFGRYLAEQLMGEIQRAGFNVIELRKTDSILIKEQFGEYGISRDIKEISKTSPADFILLGTYINKDKYLIVNARLVETATGIVASSGMKILRKDPLISMMLWPSALPSQTKPVKMPVKELGSTSDVQIIPGS